jgi:predicted O-linked N-acetylglucosamine transferase (SPINDLY family)
MFNHPTTPYRATVSYNLPAPKPPTLEEGLALHRSGDRQGASRVYQALLRTQPDNADALHLLGVATEALGDPLGGIALMDKALSLNPTLPAIHLNRANALKRLGRLEEALIGYENALRLKADYPMALTNRGTVMEALGRFEEALSAYDQALKIAPDYAEASWNKAALCLLLGDLEQGWPLFESRWRVQAHGLRSRQFAQPLWLGDSPIRGRTLLIHAEQGLGDTLQFCRLALDAQAQGAKVLLEVPAPLVTLLGSLHPDIHVFAQGQPLPAFDLHCPIASLPLAFKLRLDSIPAPVAYLKAPTEHRQRWERQLPASVRPRVGLVWSGNAAHFNDQNRSIPLTAVVSALPPGCDYFSLQREVRPSDEATLREHPHIQHWGDKLADFADTAALCEFMDVVVSVDTSVAHLAAALGRPTWILLPCLPDWRWLLDRDESPWYPSVRLFRQPRPGDWQAVLLRISQALASLSQPPAPKQEPTASDGIDVGLLEHLYLSGQFAQLETHATQLLERFPQTGFVWSVLGAALAAQGKPALDALRRAAELLPDDADAQLVYADALLNAGDAVASVAVYEQAVALAPMAAAPLNNLGNARKALGDLPGASACYQRAIALDAGFALALYNMGLCERDGGRAKEAIGYLRQAMEADPNLVEAHIELGSLLKDQGASEDALRVLEVATALAPDRPDGQLNLGALLLASGRHGEAITVLDRALTLDPTSAEAWTYRGMALLGLERTDEALDQFQRALSIKPNHAPALVKLAGIVSERGDPPTAVDLLQQALAADPSNIEAMSARVFLLNHATHFSAQHLFAEHCRVGHYLHEHITPPPLAPLSNAPGPALRVGFISGDFCNHIVARCLAPVLQHLQQLGRLHPVGYYQNYVVDAWTHRIQGYMSEWRPVAGMSAEAIAQRIRDDRIDILVDLSGHTGHNSLEVLAHRPGPVQVSWLGYTWTTGLRTVDYYLADRHWLPPGQFDALFTEKLAYLPAWLPFTCEEGAPEVSPLPASQNGQFTFGSFNHFRKLSPDVVAIWSRILAACPGATLVVGGLDSPSQGEALLTQFSRHGIGPERLRCHARTDARRYLELHGTVDLCLDPFPFPGATTLQHAAWMGVPTLTLGGSTPIACASAGVLRHLALDGFIARDTDHYVQLAVAWSTQQEQLAELRRLLRRRMAATAMSQPKAIAQGLLDVLLAIATGHGRRAAGAAPLST